MGKFRSKLKGQTKGKRWPKGQSSSSNPETRKYRDLAKSRFFQENTGSSNLTSDALRKHDAISTYVPPKIPSVYSEITDDDTESSGTSFKTMQTFASEWSDCSHVSFSRLLHVFKPSSALHKEMLAVLAAVTEVIKQKGGSESSTEYYATLMTTLEVSESEISLAAVLSLINMGLRSVPANVLRFQFAASSKIFVDLLNKNANSDNVYILKSLLGILATLLRVQEVAAWSSSSTVQIFGNVLAFVCHTKPKIRKAAQQGIISVLKGSSFMLENAENPRESHPAASTVAQFCIQQIEDSSGTSGQTTTLHTLSLLKDVIHTFPKTHMKSVCETILKILTINNPLINACGMQVLHSLFSAQKTTMPAILNGQLISALYDYQPAITDVQPILAWIAVMKQAHVHLADVDIKIASNTLPKIVTTLTQLWLSDRTEVMSNTTHALQTIFEDCIAPSCATSDVAKKTLPNLVKCFQAVESCLGYQFNKVWHQVLYIIAVMFKVAGKHCSPELMNCLMQLAELRDSYKFSYNNELENAVGAAVKSMGPDLVLQVISLRKNEEEINIDRSWLLPVLKENVEYSTLEYFAKNILPLAILCQKKSALLSANNDGIGAHSYELLYAQLWNLLPSFCRNPTDVKENFKNIAKILGTAIADRKELRFSVMSSLRKLISTAKENENEAETKEISRFAKNFLPILFNLYTTKPNGTDEEGQRLAALETVKEYLTISPPDLQTHLFTKCLDQSKSLTDPSQSFMKESILDLIRVLSQYQNSEGIKSLYHESIKNLTSLESTREQKKSYRLLEEICTSESEGCTQFLKENRKQIQSLLMKSLSSAAVSSRGARLRCLNHLVKAQPHLRHDSKFLRAVVPEAVLCCKDINEKCRIAANNLLVSVGKTLKEHAELGEFLTMLMAGLAGDLEVVTATILAMATVVHNFSDSLTDNEMKQLVEMIGQLITTSSRDVVASCLVFMKISVVTLPIPVVVNFVPVIMKSLTNMVDDCKSHFRLRVRDILDRLVRKYGCDTVAQHIPESDTVMHKRLKNLRKLNARKKKLKEAKKKEEEEKSDDEDFTVKAKPRSMEEILADSDSDLDDMEVDEAQPKARNVNIWIQEDEDNIVDFTDPSAVNKITTTKPGQGPSVSSAQKPKDRGFKTAADGRLIITEDSEDSDEGPSKKKDVINLNSDSESEDDNKSAAETAILGNKKRKRSDAQSIYSGFSNQPAMKYKAGGSGIHRPVKSSAASMYSDIGSEYKSKKAKGDVKKKGKVDPYAYLPLSRKLLNKRKRMKGVGQFKNIVRAAKSGAKKGMKAKRRNDSFKK